MSTAHADDTLKIFKIEAYIKGQYISWSRENIGDMIEDILRKMTLDDIHYEDVTITYQ